MVWNSQRRKGFIVWLPSRDFSRCILAVRKLGRENHHHVISLETLAMYALNPRQNWDWNKLTPLPWVPLRYYQFFFSKSTGGYIFLDASKATRGSKAHLISREFSGASASCLHFWYHMRADKDANGMGYLRVFIQRGKKLRRWQRWARTKNRGKRWLFKKITVNKHKQNQPFRVREGLDSLFKLFKKPLSCICLTLLANDTRAVFLLDRGEIYDLAGLAKITKSARKSLEPLARN